MVEPDRALDGRVALVTGGTSGIGRETALALADRGASVAIVGRDRKRGRAVARELEARGGGAEFYAAGLASQATVRRLADEFRGRHDRLDVLVHNAGLALDRRSETADGVEETLAVNHLAPFLLTRRLADLLVESAPARVVVVSSGLHERAAIRFDDLQLERGYDGLAAYSRSKLANVLFAYELAERLRGTGVTANAVDPGFVPSTALSRGASLRGRLALRLFSLLPLPFTRSVEEGARPVIRAASDPTLEGVTGKYFTDDGPTQSSPETYDERTRKRLWDVSAGLVGVSPELPVEPGARR
ncbi:SDR family oxidoreductase [Halegenticoccus soli]|uniref:SDR family oxidoreductase n=1 Tax=Halegenticoccus soli TaxID=1985678 RepID=UPI000C6CF331|nr:SDR family oxidoreductase [Halegenticoccus soli]